jgi:hypothetical protein
MMNDWPRRSEDGKSAPRVVMKIEDGMSARRLREIAGLRSGGEITDI